MSSLIQYAPLLLQGSLVTVAAWAVASSISIIVGTVLGIWGCRLLTNPFSSRSITLYAFIAKGIPAYVQILIAYFVIPAYVGITISGFFAATLALAFSSSGYVTEIIRSGIDVIPQGQWDAAFVLGYSRTQTLRRIIIPQLRRISIPALLGESEQLLKSTSLLATIGVTDLTRAGMNIISRELNPLTVYLLIAVIYLLFAACIHGGLALVMRRSCYDYR